MSQPKHGVNRWGNIIATATVVVAVAMLPWHLTRDKAWTSLMSGWWNGTTADFTSDWKQFGDLYIEAAPSGNLAVVYPGFDPASRQAVDSAQKTYFIGAYKLFPRRLFTAQEGAVINRGTDVITSSFTPNLAWLQQNDVQAVVTYKIAGQSELQVSTTPVPRVLIPQGGR